VKVKPAKSTWAPMNLAWLELKEVE
jgi:hypothetical protein